MLLIGSRSLALRAPGLLNRKPLDFDFVCTLPEYHQWMEKNSAKIQPTEVYELPEFHKWIVKGAGGTICEFEIVQPGSSNELLVDLVKSDPETLDTPFGQVPVLDALYTIKASHRFKKFDKDSRGFWKTANDFHLMKRMGASVREEYQEFYKLRQQESYAAQKHPKLNVGKVDFFKDDGIDYRWDHDSIHLSATRLERPAYTHYMEDGAQVNCSKEKFFAISQDIRLAGVVEEATVLSIERSKVPFGDTWSDRQAWMFALAKVASSITSGWFRTFAHDHLPEVIKLYPEGYWQKFQEDVKSGLVKPFTGSKY